MYIKVASGVGQNEKPDVWIAPQSAGASDEPRKPLAYSTSPTPLAYLDFTYNEAKLAGWTVDRVRVGRVRPAGVYVQGFARTNQQVRISTGGGFDARWSKNGSELFYQ